MFKVSKKLMLTGIFEQSLDVLLDLSLKSPKESLQQEKLVQVFRESTTSR